jgi:hypothetical protein
LFLCALGERIEEEHAKAIEDSPLESVEVRSPLVDSRYKRQ